MTSAIPARARLGPRTIAYDITRLFIGPIFLTPRGIDRVDLALARHIFADPESANLGILPTPWGVRCYSAPIVQRLLGRLQDLWAEDTPADHDAALRALVDGFGREDPSAVPSAPPRGPGLAARAVRILKLLEATGFRFGRPVRSGVPRGAIYLNVGQLGLAVPMFHNWLEERRDITCALMLHDLIPLEYPHLVSQAASAHHARMVRTVARHADCLIFNSDHARSRIDQALLEHGRADVPSLVRWLPLPAAFAEVGTDLPGLGGRHYFVTVSTIEPRKNHALLIRVWRRLVARMGDAAPHLILVGALGRGAATVLEPLRQEPSIAAHVHIVSGLSSPALASLVLGAAGVLSPSLAEGFGLPVLEATALRVPALASDIAAHREIGGPDVCLLPVDDEAQWEQAIAALPRVGQRTRPHIAHELTEQAYYSDIAAFLDSVAFR